MYLILLLSFFLHIWHDQLQFAHSLEIIIKLDFSGCQHPASTYTSLSYELRILVGTSTPKKSTILMISREKMKIAANHANLFIFYLLPTFIWDGRTLKPVAARTWWSIFHFRRKRIGIWILFLDIPCPFNIFYLPSMHACKCSIIC